MRHLWVYDSGEKTARVAVSRRLLIFNVPLNDNFRIRQHVLADLRPYICTYQNCDFATVTYASRSAHLSHENVAHHTYTAAQLNISRMCLFCGEKPPVEEHPSRHIALHMEEIAFSAVSKPHEEWSLYSDSSLRPLVDRGK